MQKLVSAIVVLSFASFLSFGQSAAETKPLLDSSYLAKKIKTVLLMETDTFSVITLYKTFIENTKEFIKAHDVEWDNELLHLFQKDKSKTTIVANEIATTAKLKERLLYRTADLLEAGKCLVYNKITKRLEKKITTENYTSKSGAGRKFTSSANSLILKIEDGVF